MRKIIPGRPGYQSDDTAKPQVPTFDPRAPKGPFGQRSGHGMNNPDSFKNGMYDAMSREADRLHPVKRSK